MRPYLLYFSSILFFACNSVDQKATNQSQQASALFKSANSAAFNQSFEKILEGYYALKDNFIAENEPFINEAATRLMIACDSLAFQYLQADTTVLATAKSYTIGISAELKGLLGEKELTEKRKSFQLVGDQLYDLIRTVQYDQAIIYHPYCSMAFDDQGANWLSNSPQIKNPYNPKKMLSCGELKDSIDFRIK